MVHFEGSKFGQKKPAAGAESQSLPLDTASTASQQGLGGAANLDADGNEDPEGADAEESTAAAPAAAEARGAANSTRTQRPSQTVVDQTADPPAEPRVHVTPPPQEAVEVHRAQQTGVVPFVQLAGMEIDVSEWIESDTGLGDLANLGSSLPIVYIAYENSPQVQEAGLKVGMWTHKASGAQKEVLDIVYVEALGQRIFQAKYEQKAEQQKPAICLSVDGKVGEGSILFDEEHTDERKITILGNDGTQQGAFAIQEGRACAECPWSQWQGRGKNAVKPACAEVYALVLHEADWGPIVVRLKSTAIKFLRAWRNGWWPKVNTLAIRWTQAHAGQRVPAKLLGQLTLGLKPFDRYYTPVFGETTQTSDERLVEILTMLGVFRGITEQLMSVESFQDVDPDQGTDDGADVPFGGDDAAPPRGGGAPSAAASASAGTRAGSAFGQRKPR